MKCKGGGHSLQGFVQGFLGRSPRKKTKQLPVGNTSRAYLERGPIARTCSARVYYAVRRATISISKDCVKHTTQIQGARHVAQLSTVANMRQRRQNVCTINIFPGMKNVSTFGRNEYVGKQGLADRAVRFRRSPAWAAGPAHTRWSLALAFFLTTPNLFTQKRNMGAIQILGYLAFLEKCTWPFSPVMRYPSLPLE